MWEAGRLESLEAGKREARREEEHFV